MEKYKLELGVAAFIAAIVGLSSLAYFSDPGNMGDGSSSTRNVETNAGKSVNVKIGGSVNGNFDMSNKTNVLPTEEAPSKPIPELPKADDASFEDDR